MKKYSFLVLCMFVLISCKKNEIKQENPILSYTQLVSKLALPDDANEEVQRIALDVRDADYEIGIIDNPNYGLFSSTPEYDIVLGGKTQASVILKIDGHTYNHDGNGNWAIQGTALKNHFGKNVEIIIEDSTETYTANVYIPAQARVAMLSSTDFTISRTGNNLVWEVDNNYPSNKVALAYAVYRTEDFTTQEGLLERGVELIDNNGFYNIDWLTSNPEVKRIYFRLVVGNSVSATFNNEKLLFTISSFDHHMYRIE